MLLGHLIRWSVLTGFTVKQIEDSNRRYPPTSSLRNGLAVIAEHRASAMLVEGRMAAVPITIVRDTRLGYARRVPRDAVEFEPIGFMESIYQFRSTKIKRLNAVNTLP
jgi:hypothetical protein